MIRQPLESDKKGRMLSCPDRTEVWRTCRDELLAESPALRVRRLRTVVRTPMAVEGRPPILCEARRTARLPHPGARLRYGAGRLGPRPPGLRGGRHRPFKRDAGTCPEARRS